MHCLYPFLIAGDCEVDLREINTLLLSSPPLSTPAHLVYRWAFNNNFQYRNFLNCFFRFLLQTTVVGLLMGKAEQMDFMQCAFARRESERAQNHLNDKSNLFFLSIFLCAITFYYNPAVTNKLFNALCPVILCEQQKQHCAAHIILKNVCSQQVLNFKWEPACRFVSLTSTCFWAQKPNMGRTD